MRIFNKSRPRLVAARLKLIVAAASIRVNTEAAGLHMKQGYKSDWVSSVYQDWLGFISLCGDDQLTGKICMLYIIPILYVEITQKCLWRNTF